MIASFQFVFHLLVLLMLFSVHHHLHLSFLRSDHHALLTHAAHHVKGALRLAPKRHLQRILLDALFDRLFERAVDLEVPVRRAQSPDPLVRPLVVVVLDPETDSRAGVIEAVELGSA